MVQSSTSKALPELAPGQVIPQNSPKAHFHSALALPCFVSPTEPHRALEQAWWIGDELTLQDRF